MKLHEMKAEKDKLENWVKSQSCLVCGKSISGAYGMHERGWSCSSKCEKAYKEKRNATQSVRSS